jgi:hypothetical protein
MKKFLVSGIGPGSCGVGRLMRVLVPSYREKGYQIVTRSSPASITLTLQKRQLLGAFKVLLDRTIGTFQFRLRCLLIFNSEVVFLHPQRAGFLTLFFLVAFNKVTMYVMDNSFFCICSYNTHPVSRRECLHCLGDIKPHSLCKPFQKSIPLIPVIDKWKNILFLNILFKISSRIHFWAQNNLQKDLLIAHFGDKTKVSVVGMDAERRHIPETPLYLASGCSYDVVFHGVSSAAKGLFYIDELSRLLPMFSFLIPDDSSNVERMLGLPVASNVSCIPMTWDTGLMEAVLTCKIVINPSMWSAPIEGALVKSAIYNKSVATVRTKFGYESEITFIENHIRLPNDPNGAARILREYLA